MTYNSGGDRLSLLANPLPRRSNGVGVGEGGVLVGHAPTPKTWNFPSSYMCPS